MTKNELKIDTAVRAMLDALDELDGMSEHICRLMDKTDWSDEAIDAVWAALGERSGAHVWLLYLFRAALRSGDITPEIDIHGLGDDGPIECDVDTEGHGEIDGWNAIGILSGKFTAHGEELQASVTLRA